METNLLQVSREKNKLGYKTQDSAGQAETSAGKAVPRDDHLSSAGELERAALLILLQQSPGVLDTQQRGAAQGLLQCFPLKQPDQTSLHKHV